MQSVNGAQFLNAFCILFIPLPAANSATVIVPLANMYASL